MHTSEKLGEFSPAFVAAQATMRPAKLDGKNPHFHSRFASLKEVAEVAKEALSHQKIAVIQSPGEYDATAKTLPITTRLLHESGEWIEGQVSLPVDRPNPQAAGSAITYGRRYALAALCGIVSEDDDDGNGAAAPPSDTRPEAYRKYQKMIERVKTMEDCEEIGKIIRGDESMAHSLKEELLQALRVVYMGLRGDYSG